MGAVDEAAVAEAVGEGGRVKSGRPRETQQQTLQENLAREVSYDFPLLSSLKMCIRDRHGTSLRRTPY